MGLRRFRRGWGRHWVRHGCWHLRPELAEGRYGRPSDLDVPIGQNKEAWEAGLVAVYCVRHASFPKWAGLMPLGDIPWGVGDDPRSRPR